MALVQQKSDTQDRAYYAMHHSAKAVLWGRPERMRHSHQAVTINSPST